MEKIFHVKANGERVPENLKTICSIIDNRGKYLSVFGCSVFMKDEPRISLERFEDGIVSRVFDSNVLDSLYDVFMYRE